MAQTEYSIRVMTDADKGTTISDMLTAAAKEVSANDQQGIVSAAAVSGGYPGASNRVMIGVVLIDDDNREEYYQAMAAALVRAIPGAADALVTSLQLESAYIVNADLKMEEL